MVQLVHTPSEVKVPLHLEVYCPGGQVVQFRQIPGESPEHPLL